MRNSVEHDEIFRFLSDFFDESECKVLIGSEKIDALYWLVSEFEGGGIHSYFTNLSGDGFYIVKDAFLESDDSLLIEWVRSAEAVFNGCVPKERDSRLDILCDEKFTMHEIDMLEAYLGEIMPHIDSVLLNLIKKAGFKIEPVNNSV